MTWPQLTRRELVGIAIAGGLGAFAMFRAAHIDMDRIARTGKAKVVSTSYRHRWGPSDYSAGQGKPRGANMARSGSIQLQNARWTVE